MEHVDFTNMPPAAAASWDAMAKETAGTEPTAEEILDAVCSRENPPLIQALEGADSDEGRFTVVRDAPVEIETTQSALFLYLEGEGAEAIQPLLAHYRADMHNFMEGILEQEPFFSISLLPVDYDGEWFLGCGIPDACFFIGDDLGKTADRLCLVFASESVVFFKEDEDSPSGMEETLDTLDTEEGKAVWDADE